MSHLHIRVVEGRDLPAADPNGLSDPYVKVKLNGGGKHKSQVIEKTLNPEWNFDAGFELGKDSANHELLFEVWDEDKMSANDFLGQVKFNVGEIMQHKVVGGFFDLLNKDFSAKAGGDIYVIMCLGDELKDDQRKSYINGIAAQLAMKNLKNKKK